MNLSGLLFLFDELIGAGIFMFWWGKVSYIFYNIEYFIKIFAGPTKKTTRLAIILDYHICNITIILGECCPEKKNNIS